MPKHTLLKTYEELYHNGRFWTRKLITGGRHSVVFHEIKKEIRGKKFLDAFAGGGRLSLMAAPLAKQVDAYDFSREAKKMFELLEGLTGVSNINYYLADTASFAAENAPYDVIAISGTLENLDKVEPDLARLTSWLKPSGMLAIDSPCFLNFRGSVYNTLSKFLGLPMTRTDKRQVDINFIKKLARKFGYRVERHLGLSYSLGWGDLAFQDLKERIPLALKDKGMKISHERLDNFFSWLNQRTEANRDMVHGFLKKGILKPIKKAATPKLKNLDEIDSKRIREIVARYYDDDFSRDPYFAELEPFNSWGGNAVYILRKR